MCLDNLPELLLLTVVVSDITLHDPTIIAMAHDNNPLYAAIIIYNQSSPTLSSSVNLPQLCQW